MSSLYNGVRIKVTWSCNSLETVICSISSNGNTSTIVLLNGHSIDVIQEDFSGYKKQPENFTLKNPRGEIVSIDAKVEVLH